MNAPLYNTQILRLAAEIPFHERLPNAAASVEKRSPVCGSRVTVDVDLDAGARFGGGDAGAGLRAGPGLAALMGAHVVGRTADEIAAARDQLTAWLAGERETIRPTGPGWRSSRPRSRIAAATPRSGWPSRRRPRLRPRRER
jgi:NifU-like protein involved in Fe-S cluster formation